MFSRKKIPTEFQVLVYAMAEELWRWEIRFEGSLLRCGTSRSREAAEKDLAAQVNT
jgi:hypothetical protein